MVFLEILILISAISITLAPALIRSALFLMQTFFLSGIYIFQLGSDIIGLLFLLVYIGAIGVLFLFVIMLIQASKNEITQFDVSKNTSENTVFDILFIFITGLCLLLFIYIIFISLTFSFPIAYDLHPTIQTPYFSETLYENSTAYSLGAALFIYYWIPFLIITMIIAVTSFGVIIVLK